MEVEHHCHNSEEMDVGDSSSGVEYSHVSPRLRPGKRTLRQPLHTLLSNLPPLRAPHSPGRTEGAPLRKSQSLERLCV